MFCWVIHDNVLCKVSSQTVGILQYKINKSFETVKRNYLKMLKILAFLTLFVASTVSRPTDDIPDLLLFLIKNTPAECKDQTYELAAKLMKTKV